MRKSQYVLLALLFVALTTGRLAAQMNADDIAVALESQAEQYELLIDQVSSLPDHLSGSTNELASKGAELNVLYEEIQAITKEAEQKVEGLRKTYDTLESALNDLAEGKSSAEAKKIYSAIADLEKLVEVGDDAAYQLRENTVDYDEKALLKTFEVALADCDQVWEGLNEMATELFELLK